EGLNLHGRCRLVLHFELPWSPLRLEQRVGRVDRIGQRRPVHELALVAGDTAERLVLAPLCRRARQARTSPGAPAHESITESRIVAAMLGQSPSDRQEPPVAPSWDGCVTTTASLRAEAEAEAARLTCERGWL